MNKARRKIISKLQDAALAMEDELNTVAEEERDTYDNMPESLQNSERGEASSNAADALESARDALQELIDFLSSAGEA